MCNVKAQRHRQQNSGGYQYICDEIHKTEMFFFCPVSASHTHTHTQPSRHKKANFTSLDTHHEFIFAASFAGESSRSLRFQSDW